MKRARKKVPPLSLSAWWPYLVVLAFGLVLLSWSMLVASVRDIGEDIAYALHPSAEHAYAIAEKHFDGQDVNNYDVARAARFFYKAEDLNPNLLYVHHELARIAFLHGDFGTAMTEIDTQIALHSTSTPNSYYVRGLIEGYMGDYTDAASDYERFLTVDPHNWAAINDYAWVLLKAGRSADAAKATEDGLQYFPDNPWLLNSSAIALYETNNLPLARQRAQKAWDAVQQVSQAQWLHSYPGNDPAVAGEGIATFRDSVSENMHRIEIALASSTVQ